MASPLVTLDRFISRLDQSLLAADTRKRLRRSQYERNRVGANIEHARDLLLGVERQTAAIRVQSQRQQQQAALQQRRERIKNLSTQLRLLSDADEDGISSTVGEEEDADSDDDEEYEDLLKRYAPAQKDAFANAGLEAGPNQQDSRLDENQQQSLRARRPLQAGDNITLASTSAREQLFAGREKSGAGDADLSDVQRTETLMSHNRREQENLTDGLLGLARALKESSLAFGASLETEKEVLKRAEGGLDKNAQGMEAAEKRMSTLRRMSEGQGWWGRVKLYGFIGGLWLACFLLVFVGPKLRF